MPALTLNGLLALIIPFRAFYVTVFVPAIH